MFGLLVKDFVYLKNVLRILAPAVVVFSLIMMMIGGGIAAYLVTGFFTVLLTAMVISMDTASHWERFALTTPLSRRSLVNSRYVFGLGSLAAAVIFSLGIAAVTTQYQPEYRTHIFGIPPLTQIALVMGTALLLLEIILPIYYRYGMNAGVIAFVFCVVIPNLFVYFPAVLTPEMFNTAAIAVCAAALLGMYPSWKIAVVSFERRDVV